MHKLILPEPGFTTFNTLNLNCNNVVLCSSHVGTASFAFDAVNTSSKEHCFYEVASVFPIQKQCANMLFIHRNNTFSVSYLRCVCKLTSRQYCYAIGFSGKRLSYDSDAMLACYLGNHKNACITVIKLATFHRHHRHYI